MFDRALTESEKKKDFQGAGVAAKTVIDPMEMCAVESKNGPVPLLYHWPYCRWLEYSGRGRCQCYMQRAATRARVHPSMIKAVTNALLKYDDLMALIAIVVSNYVEKLSTRDKRKNVARTDKQIIELLPLPSTSDRLEDDDFLFKEKENCRQRRDKNNKEK